MYTYLYNMKIILSFGTTRSKANTLLNSGSSRSHAIYILTLNRKLNGSDNSNVFQIVDLAGAERMYVSYVPPFHRFLPSLFLPFKHAVFYRNRTKANVSQQKEANNINMSLMQLWRCLQGMKRKVCMPFSDTLYV